MHNTMSHDRVHFTLTNSQLKYAAIRKCLRETLGLEVHKPKGQYYEYPDIHVVCRPSQFARFIILRHVKYKCPNQMTVLNMRLVYPKPEDHNVDVSCNPNNVNYNI